LRLKREETQAPSGDSSTGWSNDREIKGWSADRETQARKATHAPGDSGARG